MANVLLMNSPKGQGQCGFFFKWMKEIGSGLIQVLAHEFSETSNDFGVVVSWDFSELATA